MRQRILYQFLLEADNEAGRVKDMLHIKQTGRTVSTDKAVTGRSVTNAAVKIVVDVIIKIVYVLLFMYLPYRVLSSISVWEGFQLRQSIVYFTCFLSCICGSLVNSGMFDVDEDAHSLLVTMQVEPALFFKERIVYKLAVDAVGFLAAYCIIGMDFGHAFYLMLWVLISRLVGELINLYVFRYTGRAISEITIVTIAVMATCVFMAYGFPFLRGRVVDLTVYIYDYVWLLAALILAAVALYVLFNYNGYEHIAKNYIERMKLHDVDNVGDDDEYGDMLMGEYSRSGYFKKFDNDRAKGLVYLHKIFFARNLDYIRSALVVRCVLIAIAGVVGVIICRLSPEGTKDTVWNVLCNALPIMVFIMYCLSVTPKLCKSMFAYIDRDALESGVYRGKRYNFMNFIVRLRLLSVCEIIQALVMCVAFIVVAVASGNLTHLSAILPVCLGIIMLAVFYAVFNLLVYYMCQPYTDKLRTKGYTFFAAHAGMLAICYGCVYMNCGAFVFDMVLAAVLAMLFSLSGTLVYYLSDKTFRVRK